MTVSRKAEIKNMNKKLIPNILNEKILLLTYSKLSINLLLKKNVLFLFICL